MAKRSSPLENMESVVTADTVTPANPRKRWMHFLIGGIISLLFIYLLLKRVDVSQLLRTLSSVSLVTLFAAIIAIGCGYFTRSVRWWVMLFALNNQIKIRHCTGPFVLSMAINNVLPLRAGDIMRLFAFRQNPFIPAGQVLGTLVLERVLDILALLCLFFITLSGISTVDIPARLLDLIQLLMIITAVLVLCLLLLPHVIRRFVQKIASTTWGHRYILVAKITTQLLHFIDTIILLTRSIPRILSLLILSALAWLLEGGAYLIAADALLYQGSLLGPYFASAIGALSTLLPSSPGYIGTFDYFTMLGLRAFGADLQLSTAFAILVHLILWIPVTLAGFSYYLYTRFAHS